MDNSDALSVMMWNLKKNIKKHTCITCTRIHSMWPRSGVCVCVCMWSLCVYGQELMIKPLTAARLRTRTRTRTRGVVLLSKRTGTNRRQQAASALFFQKVMKLCVCGGRLTSLKPLYVVTPLLTIWGRTSPLCWQNNWLYWANEWGWPSMSCHTTLLH